MKTRCTLVVTLALLLPNAASSAPPIDKLARLLVELQRDLVNHRFGMFIHFSPTTYVEVANHIHPDHAPPRQGIDSGAGTAAVISPNVVLSAKLDGCQWADSAKSANMGFAVLTTKHHDGFRMWPLPGPPSWRIRCCLGTSRSFIPSSGTFRSGIPSTLASDVPLKIFDSNWLRRSDFTFTIQDSSRSIW